MKPAQQMQKGRVTPKTRDREEGKPTSERESIFRSLRQIADATVGTFPRNFEVAIHDLSQPQESIRYIAGESQSGR